MSTSRPSARLKGPPPTVSDVFEIVADGNADLLAEVIEFSGAAHVCELRSKNQDDYGRNLLHCAVTNGQLKTLQVLLEHDVFDPNQVDSVYTRSTPMMEAVKLGRLDLVETLIRAGGRLDVQLKNNNGEDAADVGANDVARESIRRLVAGEEAPGSTTKKRNSTAPRPRPSGCKTDTRASFAGRKLSQAIGTGGAGGGAGGGVGEGAAGVGGGEGEGGERGGRAAVPQLLPVTKGRERPKSASATKTTAPSPIAAGGLVAVQSTGALPPALVDVGGVGTKRFILTVPQELQEARREVESSASRRPVLLETQQAPLLPKVKGAATDAAVAGAATDTAVVATAVSKTRARAQSTSQT
eukprot:jgi/Undpi1/2492/HiC_scaffold_13.g05871.m1